MNVSLPPNTVQAIVPSASMRWTNERRSVAVSPWKLPVKEAGEVRLA
ncbi:MAG: hypothetical protein R2713_01255 [Ilumatobacteraceae bacterium]